MAKAATKGATVALNRRATFEYEILQRYDAGIALLGSEIKSIRGGKVNLGEGYARLRDGELFLYNVHIAQYGPARENHEPTRPRKLLLHRREIERLTQALEEQPRTTVIPLRLYLHNGLAKLEIGLARGRRRYDKREAIKRREADRTMQRAVRRAQR
ncbi:MAG: SsrA-binding protein SmpB [Chloroflexi bacterium]|nr:SsrA-binding protein SmpB [Chloroflexota bacterium]MBM4419844.1 SsrA-binding protein SmpB [Chloroflexota bacterium]